MPIAMVLFPQILLAFWCVYASFLQFRLQNQAALASPNDGRYKVFMGIGGITCILAGNLRSSSEEVRSILIIFKLFNVRPDPLY